MGIAPFLFIAYINDLQDVTSGPKLLSFSDNKKIIFKIKSPHDTFLLQNNLNIIIEWSTKNNMELNRNKFEYISHKSQIHSKNLDIFNNSLPFPISHSQYYASDYLEITRSTHVKDLGVIVDEKLNWKLHVNTIYKKCKQLCGWVLSVFHTRDKSTMLILFKSLIRSKLEYGCEVFNPYQINQIVELEQIQRTFTSRIIGMENFNYWERLQKLGQISLQRREKNLL